MEWYTKQKLKWAQFNLFNGFEIKHGFFTRHGGVSPHPWASLNLGGTVGDTQVNISENKDRLLDAFSLSNDAVYDAWQVHSADYIRVDTPRAKDVMQAKADILVSNTPGIVLMMRFADCVPLWAYDPKQKAIGIAHAGWIGTTKDVAGVLVRSMTSEFGSNPKDILVGIGPSIGQEHYPVGDEVVEAVKNVINDRMNEDIEINGQPHLDLWKMNEIMLRDAGVEQIETAGICTVCHNDDWYSHRGEKGKTGRFGAIIGIPE